VIGTPPALDILKLAPGISDQLSPNLDFLSY